MEPLMRLSRDHACLQFSHQQDEASVCGQKAGCRGKHIVDSASHFGLVSKIWRDYFGLLRHDHQIAEKFCYASRYIVLFFEPSTLVNNEGSRRGIANDPAANDYY